MMKTNTTMKTTMCSIAATLVLSAFAQDDLNELLAELERGTWSSERLVSSEEFQKILACTNDQQDVATRVKIAMRVHKMRDQYEQMEHLQRRVDEAKAEADNKTLTAEEFAQLSEPAKKYYEKNIVEVTNKLASVMHSRDELWGKWTADDISGFSYWKERRTAKEIVRKMNEKMQREKEELEEDAREEVEKVRRRHRKMSCEFKDGSICWGGNCYEGMSTPEHCSQKIKECDENLKTMRANLTGLERMKEDRFAKLSPLAQKKFHDKLANLKVEIEETEFKKKKYEEFWAAKKWSSMSAWKKQQDANEMKKKRQQAEEALAEAELKLSLIQAAEEVGESYEERPTHNRWF